MRSAIELSVFISLASAIAACFSAYFSFRSSRVASRISQANLYLKFHDQYSGDQMVDDLRNLRAWRDKHGENFAEVWADGFAKGDVEAVAVDKSRRRVKYAYFGLADLVTNGFISKRLAKVALQAQGIDLLYEVAEPLDQALNPAYRKAKYDALWRLQKYTGKPQPLSHGTRVVGLKPPSD